MPNAKPNVKNIRPTNANGMAKFLFDCCAIVFLNWFIIITLQSYTFFLVEQTAIEACRLLMQNIAGSDKPVEDVVLRGEIVERESTINH